VHDLFDASPLVLVLGAALNYAEAFQNVDDIIDASTLNAELLRALVEVEESALGRAVEEEETAAELA